MIRNKKVNIAIIGLGQIGSYLYNELKIKKKEIEIKAEKKLILLPYLQKIKIKKDNLRLTKVFFTQTH